MKIVHVTYSENGGAGTAAYRIYEAMRKSEIQVAFLSAKSSIGFDNNNLENDFFKYRKPALILRMLKKLKSYVYTSREQLTRKELGLVKSKLDYEILSLPVGNDKLHLHPLIGEADIVHLHWVSGFLNYEDFFSKCKKPIVWTFHDMNPFLGVFHYLNDVQLNNKIIGHLEKYYKDFKQKYLKSENKIGVICPSQWMQESFINSNFNFKNKLEVIPNTLDFDVFKPYPTIELRESLKLSKDELVLLFVAENINNKRKGMDLLLEALKGLKIKTTLVTIGGGLLPEINGYTVLSLGSISSPQELANIYSLADVFVLPSREDNLPNVMLESFACGTPVISFSNGGMREHVIKDKTGLLAKNVTANSLQKAILNFHKTKTRYHREEIVNYAKSNFCNGLVVNRHMNLYKDILKENTIY
jgi:glycosyltransferase involved in cell wall biosynthesis